MAKLISGTRIYGNLTVDTFVTATGNVVSTANVTGGNILTAGLVSATGNVSGGNLNVTGNIVDSGALSIITGSNGNIALVPNGTGIVTASGNLSAAGNITGSYILGNGSQLTGLPATYGNTNVAAYLASGSDSSNIITTANVSGGNVLATTIVSGASVLGSIFSASGNITSAANVLGGNLVATTIVSGASHIGTIVSVTANITGGNLLTAGLISATGNITSAANVAGGNLLATTIVSGASHIGSVVSVSGNITGGNLNTGAQVVATGNITGGNILTAGQVSATGNVSGGNLNVTGNIVDTGALTIITGSNGNIALAPNGTGIVTSSSALSATGNITSAANVLGGNLVATTIVSGASHVGTIVSVTANITGGNLLTGGLISATGTVTGSSLLGSVVSVTGNITGGNLNTGAQVVATGNITGGNILTAGQVSATGNVSGGNLNVTGNIVDSGALSIITGSNGNIALVPNGTGIVTASGNISAVGNISGNYILGNGSQLTGLPATYGNTNVAAYLASGSDSSNIITTANVSGGNVLATTIVSGASHIGSIVSVSANVTGGNLITGDNSTIYGGYTTLNNQGIFQEQGVGPRAIGLNIASGYGIGFRSAGGATDQFIYSSNSISFVTGATLSSKASPSFGASSNTGVSITQGGFLSVVGNTISGNLITGGLLSTVGNIYAGTANAGYVYGNAYFMTGISAAISVTKIENGNSNVWVNTPGGDVTVTAGGVSNVAVFSTGSLTLQGALGTPKTITSNIIVAGGINAMLIGPLVFGNGFNLTVPDSSTVYVYSPNG